MSLLTKRMPTILGLLLFVALIVGAFYYFQGKNVKTSSTVIPDKVRISNIADNKFSVSWVSQEPTTGSVEYGPVGEKLTTIARDERDSESTQGTYTTHHVTIESLQPSTQYAFRILVGPKPNRFDNNGSPYTTSTGPVIGATPTSQNFYGNVQLPSKQAADGSIAYITLPGGATASTLVRESGNYAFTLSTIRTTDLRSYIKYDPAATIASLTVESGKQQSIASVSLANSAPVPTITLGQNADFLNQAQIPTVAEVQPIAEPSTTPSTDIPMTTPSIAPTATPEVPSIFNVEPLSAADINVVSTGAVVILNPKEDGETLATLRPEFRGTGPAGTTLSIALTGQKAVSDTVKVSTDKTWSWAPVIDLKVGAQKIAVSYLNSDGKSEKIEKTFTISTSKVTSEPAFVSSPSASVKATAVATATPRAAMPATESGVPVTGAIENTIIMSVLAMAIMLFGVTLLVI